MNEQIMMQVVVAYMTTQGLEYVKRWKAVPWITVTSDTLNKWVGALLALLTTIGITVAGTWDPQAHTYTLVIAGLNFAAILGFVGHWLSQFIAQQILYKTAVKPYTTKEPTV